MMNKLRQIGRRAALVAAVAGALVIGTATPANAAWTRFTGTSGVAIVLACKTAISSEYGPLWRVTLVAATTPGTTAGVTFNVVRGQQVVSTTRAEARDGAWDVKTAYASILLGDTYTGVAGTGLTTGEGKGGPIEGTFDTIANC